MSVPYEERMRFFREAAEHWSEVRRAILMKMIDGESAWKAAVEVHREMCPDRAEGTIYQTARSVEDAARAWLGRTNDLELLREQGVVRGLSRGDARRLVREAREAGLNAVVEVAVRLVE